MYRTIKIRNCRGNTKPEQTIPQGQYIRNLRTEFARKQGLTSGHREEEYVLHPETPDDHPETPIGMCKIHLHKIMSSQKINEYVYFFSEN